MLVFRKAETADIPDIKKIYEGAIEFMAECGLYQWKLGYPFSETPGDIERGILYVLYDGEKNRTAAVTVVDFDTEHSYDRIYNGAWMSSLPYCAIHRIAISADYRRSGCGSRLVAEAEKLALDRGVHSVRVDTKHDNLVMQGMIRKNGFSYCGVILLASGESAGEERIAFEKLI